MKLKYKSGDVLTDKGGRLILIYAHSFAGHFYFCGVEWSDNMVWLGGRYIDDMEKIGVL